MNFSAYFLRLTPVLALSLLTGCFGKPNAANIELRKENQKLRDQIVDLERQRAGALADAAAARRQGSLATLPADRLKRLFTTHDIQLGRLTGGFDSDADAAGDEGLKIYAVPLDDEGQKFKAAGSFLVEAFDLSSAEQPLVGKWTFDAAKAREFWNGALMRYEYVLPCMWTKMPTHPEITVKITFTDELTGRTFTAQKPVTIALPARPK